MKKILLSILTIVAAAVCSFNAGAVSVWDGSTDTDWAQDANGNYLITSAAELAGLSKIVYEMDHSLKGVEWHAYYGSGMTFLLTTNIDLNNLPWNPIGYLAKDMVTNTNRVKHVFCGTFDGQGHTIYNCNASLKEIRGEEIESSTTATVVTVGLFGAINGATIKNLNVANSSFSLESNCHENHGGAIVGWMENGSKIENCSSINNSVTVLSPWYTDEVKIGFITIIPRYDYGNAYAGGIAGGASNSTITNCTVAENDVYAEGALSEHNDNISNNYIGSSVSETDNYVYGSIADINRATIIANNWGSGSTSPYYLDETTGIPTNKIYYALEGIIYNGATDSGIRNEAQIYDNAEKMNFDFNNTTYTLYPAGTPIVAEFYLEGFNGDWNIYNSGYYVDQITDGANVLAGENDGQTLPETGLDENNNPTFSYETGRFLRVQQFTIPMPAAKTTLYYTTKAQIPTSVESATAATRAYAANGMIVVEAANETNVVVVDMAGRVVYNGIAKEGRNELKVENGFYIVNGTKVVVR